MRMNLNIISLSYLIYKNIQQLIHNVRVASYANVLQAPSARRNTVSDISKPWDWSKNTQDFWNEPSAESYYLLHRLQGNSYSRFLDLGCGLGRHSLLFANTGFQVYSFDLSSTAIDELQRHCITLGLQNIVCSIGDMQKLPYPNTSFDCLLAYHVISHTDTQGIKTIINEIDRVLARKGEFFLTLCSKRAWSFQEAGYPKHDDNTEPPRDCRRPQSLRGYGHGQRNTVFTRGERTGGQVGIRAAKGI